MCGLTSRTQILILRKMSTMTTTSPTKGHVVVIPFPFTGHVYPLFDLVCKLASSAPAVRFSFINSRESNVALFRPPSSRSTALSSASQCQGVLPGRWAVPRSFPQVRPWLWNSEIYRTRDKVWPQIIQ
ncbi:hypothetical protein MLD38_015029 [Melastoma candidum]|uniref:Uncharacterized protein n=1 Tax=Melastoma candidum TaxID=119954 RepID=A0ACB9RGM2_9MYRT|nr:hypothetical protein MLD38_015029 [Melastoma candidum]